MTCDEHRAGGPDPEPDCPCAWIDRLVTSMDVGSKRPLRDEDADIDAGLADLRAGRVRHLSEIDR